VRAANSERREGGGFDLAGRTGQHPGRRERQWLSSNPLRCLRLQP